MTVWAPGALFSFAISDGIIELDLHLDHRGYALDLAFLDDRPASDVANSGQSLQVAATPSAALPSAAMSSLLIPSIAFIARSARFGSGSANNSAHPAGTTCQDSP